MYEEIQGNYPLEFALRDQDKYRYRYPKGEVSGKMLSSLYVSFNDVMLLISFCEYNDPFCHSSRVHDHKPAI